MRISLPIVLLQFLDPPQRRKGIFIRPKCSQPEIPFPAWAKPGTGGPNYVSVLQQIVKKFP